ncbi:YtpI family protein [Paenibacillus tarimensis]
MVVLQWLLIAGIIAMLLLTVFFSMKSRRSRDVKFRGLNAARMNICMGVMLVLLSLIQMVMFSGSSVRVIVGSLFLVLGLFNLFAGLRNHSIYGTMKEK